MLERIGFGQRLVAWLIDAIVIGVVGVILGMLLGGILGASAGAAVGAGAQQDTQAATAAGGAIGGILGMLMGAAVGSGIMGIVWIAWEGMTGAALGKRLLKIRIKNDDGTPAPVGKLMTRAGLKYSNLVLGLIGGITGIAIISKLSGLAGLIIFVGCFLVLGASRQAIHDMIAKTAVYPEG